MSQMESFLKSIEPSRRRSQEEEEEHKSKSNYNKYLIIIGVILYTIFMYDFFTSFRMTRFIFKFISKIIESIFGKKPPSNITQQEDNYIHNLTLASKTNSNDAL